MTMLTCRECKAAISSEAKACPHCGVSAPARTPPVIGGFVIAAIIALAVIIAAFLALAMSAAKISPAEKALNNEDEEAAVGAVRLRDEMMRNPVRFQLALSFVVDHEWHCYVFRGENGFGGLNQDVAVYHNNDLEVGAGALPDWTAHCTGSGGRKNTRSVQSLVDRYERLKQ